MKLNTDKCHLMVLGRNSNEQVKTNVSNSVIENTEEKKLLGVVVDKQINFDMHTNYVRRLEINFSPSLAFPNTWNLINSES